MNSSYDTRPSLSTSMCDRMRLMSLRVRPSSAALSASLNSCLGKGGKGKGGARKTRENRGGRGVLGGRTTGEVCRSTYDQA